MKKILNLFKEKRLGNRSLGKIYFEHSATSQLRSAYMVNGNPWLQLIQTLMLKIVSLLVWLLLVIMAGSSSDNNTRQRSADSTMVFQVGYRSISFADSSRTYRPGVEQSDPLYFRPIDIDLWYPAKPVVSDSILKFGYFLQLLQDRANFYSAPQKFDSLPTTVAKSFCDGFGCSQPALLLQSPTHTFNRAKPVSQEFPLVVYFASFGSMGYENYLLFESLASQGYIIACVNSIGRYPGDMTMKNADLMEQVRDADQIMNRLKLDNSIDTTKIGVLGYSWGGLAGALWAMQRKGINAMVSLDGSEVHHYGNSKSEDQDFEYTISTPFFEKSTLSVPYLRLESNPEPNRSEKDSTYNFLRKVKAAKQVVKIDSARHQDFSSLATIIRTSGKCSVPKVYYTISSYTISYFNKHLKGQE
ncbi:alpha/beta hydrolase [Dyadobacter chenwenxiniae]|uniref:Alpha/beta hydrolase n=1 Tax=Dyadobacter chenwenxiniae TaxID=2906456 RepID=A0A9X1PHN8_9BACT|nr:alpha/beta hydrolase [Dyadobacter chenwenxiniae]MCF0060229.1 alpha/beta hydrolase [Dyadobacter chenwenxiniae]UON85966.1 alpha/beta hydrolase [Dyadobacter chenwenxiniae]